MEQIALLYPLHILVWKNSHEILKEELARGIHNIEAVDNRGCTPLLLAVRLGHLQCISVLLEFNVNVHVCRPPGWSVMQEAIASGNREIYELLNQYQTKQWNKLRPGFHKDLIRAFETLDDFYIEMKWELNSWVPLISNYCPSDHCKIWKKGANLRIDYTFKIFTNETLWDRAKSSIVIRTINDTVSVELVDHEKSVINRFLINETKMEEESDSNGKQQVDLWTQPICTFRIEKSKLEFERTLAGFYGMRYEKTEEIDGFECQVYDVNKFEITLLSRMEHMSTEDKENYKRQSSCPNNLKVDSPTSQQQLCDMEKIESSSIEKPKVTINVNYNPAGVSEKEYFDKNYNFDSRDIGRAMDLTTKTENYKANLWMCQNYPISTKEIILSFVEIFHQRQLMSDKEYEETKDFFLNQAPNGFPLKIEIPLYRVFNLQISFHNVFATEKEVNGVKYLSKGRPIVGSQCEINESIFTMPDHYVVNDLQFEALFQQEKGQQKENLNSK